VAAHIEGKSAQVLDMSGLAQKGGQVTSHVQIAASPDDLHATRVGTAAAEQIMADLGAKPEDYTYVVFHQPNVKFPQRAAHLLGFKPDQYKAGLLVNDIGNTYAGSSLLGLTAILDVARPGDRVLEVSFGSGAGSDAFSLRITERITERQGRAPKTRDYVNRRTQIDYATYTRFRKKLTMV
jgi:hydroxymethylglutaryl-CoA synthase